MALMTDVTKPLDLLPRSSWNLDWTWSDLSKSIAELVECRRRGKLNAHSQTLMTRLDESIDNVEKMLTYATLRYSKKG